MQRHFIKGYKKGDNYKGKNTIDILSKELSITETDG